MTFSLQDGWSDTHRHPVIAATLHCDNETFPLDFLPTGSNPKTAAYCTELAKDSIKKAEEAYGCVVIGFVSDNEPKMRKVREVNFAG